MMLKVFVQRKVSGLFKIINNVIVIIEPIKIPSSCPLLKLKPSQVAMPTLNLPVCGMM